ncbi:ketopantoate hydroxymethyltransferase [Austwickia chelonae]|uniref:3-methyl-2-oxobutanoate hydroxymethyltransferase n=1 Tax=Austwickia chelonae NBRC 105200 TaxID=1184607 RepID=K6ULE6_9MICO|nr:3-methyl-2-oxobutanoate hydroxymethyltransferase [Austwickia chelonae]GAB77181.1 3-methyl-2-oxobutanoate hydroxymethyltransferase [Austwickia chelonae NBRC 105200]SEW04609.1 ketopantoate hydroxymethyltransferase [Austwickia chelonae]
MRLSVADLHARYLDGQRLTMVTGYDYTSARIIDRTEIPLILVGDSLGMVVQGHDSTLPVTVEEILYHTRSVARGANRALIVADLPFLSYSTPQDAIRHSGRLLAEGGAGSVKLEGGVTSADTIRCLVDVGIPVMGHIGFTPQAVHHIGLCVQGKNLARATQIYRDALAVEESGAWAVVLELIPSGLARAITERLAIPTIGIGAGPHCDGEVQVWHDILGLYDDFVPRHTRRFADLAETAARALEDYHRSVLERSFPTGENSSSLDEDILSAVLVAVDHTTGLPSGER